MLSDIQVSTSWVKGEYVTSDQELKQTIDIITPEDEYKTFIETNRWVTNLYVIGTMYFVLDLDHCVFRLLYILHLGLDSCLISRYLLKDKFDYVFYPVDHF